MASLQLTPNLLDPLSLSRATSGLSRGISSKEFPLGTRRASPALNMDLNLSGMRILPLSSSLTTTPIARPGSGSNKML